MKRRLNILCLVVMLVLSYSVLEQGYYIFLGAKMGAQTGLELGTGCGICGRKGRYPCVAAEADAYEVYKLGIT